MGRCFTAVRPSRPASRVFATFFLRRSFHDVPLAAPLVNQRAEPLRPTSNDFPPLESGSSAHSLPFHMSSQMESAYAVESTQMDRRAAVGGARGVGSGVVVGGASQSGRSPD